MLTFKQFIQLIEAKIDDYKSSESSISTEHDPDAKFHTTPEIIDHFHSFNKSGNVENTKWIVNQYKQGNIKQEDAPRMGELIGQFEKSRTRLPKKKLSQYSTHGELESALNTTKNDTDFFSMTPEQQKVADKSPVLHKTPNLEVVHPQSTQESIVHGDKMPWCTSRKDEQNMFNHYQQRTGNRVYIGKLPNEQYPYRKIIIGVGANEFQDEKNERIQGDRLKDFISRNPELKEVEPLQGSVLHITRNPKEHFDDLIQNDQEELFDHMDKNPGLYDKEHWALRNSYKDDLKKAERGDSSVVNSRFRGVLAKLAQISEEPEILDKLAQSPHTEVRQHVGSNVFAPKETRKNLFNDVSPVVRGMVNMDDFHPEEKINALKNERNPEVISIRLQKQNNEDVNREVVAHHLPKLQEFISKAISNGDHMQNWFKSALDHGMKYGYITSDHKKKMGNLLLDKIKKGIHTPEELEHAENYGYLRMGYEFNKNRGVDELRDHHKALINDLSKKLDSGNWNHFDLDKAKKYGYLDKDEHIPKLKNWLSDKLDSGNWNHFELDNAKKYGYFDEDEHIPKLKNWFSDKLDSGDWAHFELNTAKKYGYFDENEHIPKLKNWLSDKLDSGNWNHGYLDTAIELGYLDKDEHIPKLKNWFSDNLDYGDWTHGELDVAKKYGYFDKDKHIPKLKNWLSDKLDSGNWKYFNLDNAKKYGYFDENEHIPKLKNWFSDKLDSGNWNHNDLDNAKKYGYFDENEHIPKLQKR